MANVTGGDKVRARWGRVMREVENRVENELVMAAEKTRTMVVADIRRQKLAPGQVPQAGPGRRKHIPSPPYGPPNSDTGRLMASYTTDLSRAGSNIISRVVAGVRYARWLEFGTSKMLPRPHLLPRFREQAIVLRTRFAGILREVNGRR